MSAESFLAPYLDQIRAVCKRYAVRRLRLFGSAVTDDWDPQRSDFDFLAEFGPSHEFNKFQQFMGFISELEHLLGRRVDVVDWTFAKNPFFKRHAEQAAREIYAA